MVSWVTYIDLFDAADVLLRSDDFQGLLAGFAVSALDTPIGPGTYTLVASGTGLRDSSLDISLSFVGTVPEPETYAMMLAGLGAVGLLARGRRPDGAASR